MGDLGAAIDRNAILMLRRRVRFQEGRPYDARCRPVAVALEASSAGRVGGGACAQYISLKPKRGKQDKKAPHLAYYQKAKSKKQGAFDVQITRNGYR